MNEISSTSSLDLVHNLQAMPALQATDCTVEAGKSGFFCVME